MANSSTYFNGPTEVADFINYDYKGLMQQNIFGSASLHPAVPFVSVALYWFLSTPLCNFVRTTFKLEPKGAFIQNLTIVHSSLLAVYSLWTFIGSTRVVYSYYQQHGLLGAMCDNDHELWDLYQFGFWSTHFYLSKYYEFVDTWIVLLKGREPIFLQTYHHAGIVICMWVMVLTKSSTVFVCVILNSFIHTIMYTYYVYAALGYSSPLKHYLTSAQIIQFFTGIGLSVATFFHKGCLTPAQAVALGSLQLYAVYLIYLFWDFYRSSYLTVKSSKKGGAKEEKNKNL